ncbi:MAG TPA: vanadium-dependent haloperoxidase [Bacillota bacterium]|nr:vanadium-dependent haloperoxidase [Bacillota bacterium]
MVQKNYKLWTELPYAGETEPPSNPSEPHAGYWPLFFFRRDLQGHLTDPSGKPVKLRIKDPHLINWQKQLQKVQSSLDNLTEDQIKKATYWGTGGATKQWTPIVDRLIDTYGVTAPKAARILAAVNAGINDAFVVAWSLKYTWLVARPNQLDSGLATLLCTPRHPSYPSGHATISGCASEILQYFFPTEADHLKALADECALSRLYAGVHFQADDDEGLRLGKQLGRLIIRQLRNHKYHCKPIDIPDMNGKNAELPPPPYEQVIPFDFAQTCESLVRK